MAQQKTIVLTGASDGIGAAAARQLTGHRLILVGRSPAKTAAVAGALGAEHHVADFARLDGVRELAARIRETADHVDVLANNAGGVLGRRELTVDGIEKTLQVNHLAPFLLTHLLLDLLQAGEGSVVNTSSSGARLMSRLDISDVQNERSYRPGRAYGDAKLANILFTRGLQARYSSTGINSVAFDPGNVRTNFAAGSSSLVRLVYRTPLSRLVLIPAEKGGANLAFFVDGTAGTTWLPGRFYTQTALATPGQTNPRIFDDALVDALWTQSAALVGLPAA
ncbi:SDR family NAD(P)-dependent oxidoreductase [Cellulomonas sp. McL0617]|uniref:SDR family NAD(P)-dependent oxidoreductase n=1 Tax=Cellulomonas sp. McL0617 TaxID=3415675 RepID=UPI003CE992A5